MFLFLEALSMDIPLFAFFLMVTTAIWGVMEGFPQGAPAEACETLLPRHFGTEALPPDQAPFTFRASANHYSSNSDGIHVELSGNRFKGFLIAAVDPKNKERIGEWYRVKGTTTLPCSAISHSDPYPKKKVILLWRPPPHRHHGHVIFVATVLQSYGHYYSGIVARAPEENDRSY